MPCTFPNPLDMPGQAGGWVWPRDWWLVENHEGMYKAAKARCTLLGRSMPSQPHDDHNSHLEGAMVYRSPIFPQWQQFGLSTSSITFSAIYDIYHVVPQIERCKEHTPPCPPIFFPMEIYPPSPDQ
uniref:Uncharacterized protein n=1 Tax=Eutreptiella gymnastica TaxID=73025 RepID=A0A7S1IRW5_9EUGL